MTQAATSETWVCVDVGAAVVATGDGGWLVEREQVEWEEVGVEEEEYIV